MRILAVHPGATFSTADVYNGLTKALKRAGADLYSYNLDTRISMSGGYLKYVQRRHKARGKELSINEADVLYHASQDLLARALRIEADWVLVFSGMYLHPDWMILMQRAGIKLAVILTESPYDDEPQMRFVEHCEIAWTNERTSVQYLRQFNRNVHYLPHSYDPDVHNPTPLAHALQDFEGHDVIFVGTCFIERQRILEGVDWRGIDLGLYGTYPLVGSRSKLRTHIHGTYVANASVAEMYRRSRIGLNLYRTSIGFGRNPRHIAGAESINPRQLELAACGVFSISDYRAEAHEVFGPHVPTFSDPSDLGDIIRHYLDNPSERERLAKTLPSLVKDRTFDNAASIVLDGLGRIGTQGPAMMGAAALPR